MPSDNYHKSYSTLNTSLIRTTKLKGMSWTRMAKTLPQVLQEHNIYYRRAKFRKKKIQNVSEAKSV